MLAPPLTLCPCLPVVAGADGQPGNGSNGNPERASSLLAGTFTTAALNALSISEDALPPPEQLIAMMEASGGPWCCTDLLAMRCYSMLL